MTDLDIKAIRERAEKATPGPWEVAFDSHAPGNGKIACWLDTQEESLPITGAHEAYRDLEFCAAARTDVPALCDEVEQLRGELRAIQFMASESIDIFPLREIAKRAADALAPAPTEKP